MAKSILIWTDYEGANSSILFVNECIVATVQEGDEKHFQIYAYDSDFQDVFSNKLGNCIVEFDTIEEAKKAAEDVFMKWLKEVNGMLLK